MIGFSLTQEQQQLQATARGYAESVLKPLVARTLSHPPADKWDAVRPALEAGVALGFTHMLVPEAQGGLGLSCVDAAIVLEEIGAVDVGVASDYFSLTMTMPLMFARGGTADQAEQFLSAFVASPCMVLAGAQSEPTVAGSELMMAGPDAMLT